MSGDCLERVRRRHHRFTAAAALRVDRRARIDRHPRPILDPLQQCALVSLLTLEERRHEASLAALLIVMRRPPDEVIRSLARLVDLGLARTTSMIDRELNRERWQLTPAGEDMALAILDRAPGKIA